MVLASSLSDSRIHSQYSLVSHFYLEICYVIIQKSTCENPYSIATNALVHLYNFFPILKLPNQK